MKKIFILCSCIVVLACDDLNVPNTNNPDESKVLRTPSDLAALVNGSYINFWNALHKDSPYHTLTVAGDIGSASWGNFGMQDVGTVDVPYGLGSHKAINNSLTYTYRAFYETPWQELWKAIGAVNKVLKQINLGNVKIIIDDVDVTDDTKASAYFLRGICYGYLSLLFDQSFVVTEDTDVTALAGSDLKPYADVYVQAMSDLEETLSVLNTASQTYELRGFNGVSYTKTQLEKMANSYMARFTMLLPRDPTEAESTDWVKVLQYAQLGIDNFNIAPLGDGGDIWWHAWYRTMHATWHRVDQKIVNMVDPNQPYPYPESGSYTVDFNAIPDKRFSDSGSPDFLYQQSVSFNPTRGIYFFSNWKFNRYNSYRLNLTDPMPTFTVAENDLMISEALVRSGGDKAAAALLVNNTRVNRGGLTPLDGSETTQALLDAIQYERYLETYEGPGNGFFDRRRNDDLGLNQFRQFPIPASELAILQAPVYTFGGPGQN